MTTTELKQYTDKVLGNSIRCLLPSYWWKRLFNQVADRIDGAEQFASELVEASKMPIVESEKELNKLDVEDGSLASVLRLETRERSFRELYQAPIFEILGGNVTNCNEIEDIITNAPNTEGTVSLVFGTADGSRSFTIHVVGKTMIVLTVDDEELPLYAQGTYYQEGHDYLHEELSSFQYKFVVALDMANSDLTVDYDIVDTFLTCVATLPTANVYVKGNTWEQLAKQGESGGGGGGIQAITIYPLDRSTMQDYHRQVYDAIMELAAKEEDFIVYAEVGTFTYPATTIAVNPIPNTPHHVFDFKGWVQTEIHEGSHTEKEHYSVALFADGTMQLDTTKDFVIDHVISDTSTNAVQNKVVTSALNAKADKTYVDNAIASAITNTLNTPV